MREITRDSLVNWFKKNYNNIWVDMVKCSHGVDVGDHIKFHNEETIACHTLLAMTVAEQQEYSNILLPVMLLHDIGKPYVEEVLEKKFRDYPEDKIHERFQVEYKDWWELDDDINISFLDYLISKYGEINTYKRFSGHEGISTMMAIDILEDMSKDFNIDLENQKVILELISLHGCRNESVGSLLSTLRNLVRKCDKDGAVRMLEDKDNLKYSQYEGRNFSSRGKAQEDKSLVIMVGLPNSGKSTFVRENLKEYTILSRDSYIIDYYNTKFANISLKSRLTTYNDIYGEIHRTKESRQEFDSAFERYCHKINQEESRVVIDMTMMSMSSRRKMLNKFKTFTADCIVLLTGAEELEKRELERSKVGKAIPRDVYFNMSKSFIMPTVEEGFETVSIML